MLIIQDLASIAARYCETDLNIVSPRVFGLVCSFFLIFVVAVSPKHVRERKNDRPPPKAPYTFPIIKSTFSFLLDRLNFIPNLSRLYHDEPAIKIGLLSQDIYLVHGAKAVAQTFRNPSLSVTAAHAFFLHHCFGMTRKAAAVYSADTSGSQAKPIEGSDGSSGSRPYHGTHKNLLQGLLGAGLAPTFERFQDALAESFEGAVVSEEWVEYPDLLHFFEDHVGAAVIRSIFGGCLLDRNPGFVRNLWTFDGYILSLAKCLPWLCIPKAYKVRAKLLKAIEEWHTFAEAQSTSHEDGDCDAHAYWGSTMVKERYKMLREVKNQDRKSIAATDLGLMWTTITNVVPSTMTLASHIFRDADFLSPIRQSAAQAFPDSESKRFNLQPLESDPLLMSMYAETLRSTVQIHVPRTSPHNDVKVGDRTIPASRTNLILADTHLAHNNPSIWNSRIAPLGEFHSHRFIVDPSDPKSGPLARLHSEPNGNGPHFSLEGLEGSFIPYGGGTHACPGRVLAKRIMLFTSALTAHKFDLEILADEKAMQYTSPRFGFGVKKPAGRVRFRIRRRCGC